MIACTSKPNFESKFTATDPTPPVAPETNIGLLKDGPASNIFFTHAPAVRPAVPNDMEFNKDKLFGRGITHFSGT